MSKNEKMFHLSMTDTVLHIIVLYYLINYVPGQPKWYYWIGMGLMGLYTLFGLLLICNRLISYRRFEDDSNNHPKHP